MVPCNSKRVSINLTGKLLKGERKLVCLALLITNCKEEITCHYGKLIHSTYTTWGEGNGNPLQSSCLENPMDRGAWWAAVRGVTESQTRLSDSYILYLAHYIHSAYTTWHLSLNKMLP